jgi:hypothetical protein
MEFMTNYKRLEAFLCHGLSRSDFISDDLINRLYLGRVLTVPSHAPWTPYAWCLQGDDNDDDRSNPCERGSYLSIPRPHTFGHRPVLAADGFLT